MAKTPFKTGLFARMLTLCVLSASLCAALVTFAFYTYREALTTNRLAAELSAQAYATAPIIAGSLSGDTAVNASRVLRSFGGL
ncbi:MAG: hypothetical protein VX073_01660, partial [Pseudomonadota bacterium]|nr:hypothetical protein [Pseudomonadota bacterium]